MLSDGHHYRIFVAFGNVRNNFPTLISMVEYLSQHSCDLVVQTGHSEIRQSLGDIQLLEFCSHSEFEKQISLADIVICHAGIGTISEVLKFKKMPIVVARDSRKHEHINDHQKEFVEFYINDNIFIEAKTPSDIENIIKSKSFLHIPSRNYITDLSNLRNDILQYIRSLR